MLSKQAVLPGTQFLSVLIATLLGEMLSDITDMEDNSKTLAELFFKPVEAGHKWELNDYHRKRIDQWMLENSYGPEAATIYLHKINVLGFVPVSTTRLSTFFILGKNEERTLRNNPQGLMMYGKQSIAIFPGMQLTTGRIDNADTSVSFHVNESVWVLSVHGDEGVI